MKNGLISLILFAAGSVLAAGVVWTAFPPEFALQSLLAGNGGAGLSISHNSDDFYVADLGRCIAAIGDTNGDGADDFLLGSRGVSDSTTGVDTPQAFVIYGGSQIDGLAVLEINDLYSASGGDGTRGRVIYGTERFIGESCSGAGDINADGYSDFILLGNPTHYVVYGGPNEVVGPELDVETLEPAGGGDGSRGFQLLMPGVDTFRVTLDRATGAGDLNNDSIDDIAVGSPEQQAVYVIYGRASGFPAAFDPDSLRPANGGDGTAGIVIVNSESSPLDFGDSVGLIDDFNGDGIDDLAVNDGSHPRHAFVVFGSDSAPPALFDVADLFLANGGDGSRGIVLHNAFGPYIDDAGDFNGDGNNDLVVLGPEFSSSERPNISVVFGGPAMGPAIDLFELIEGDGSAGTVIQGYRDYIDDFMGEWASGVGDINGDGFDDISIAGLSIDESFIVYGSSAPPATISLFELTGAGSADGTQGFLLRGYDSFGYTKSVSAGDVNTDGRPDLLTADAAANLWAGRADIIFGRGDDDSDGIGDFDDNCIESANPDQRDTDNDGFGNICDADLDNDLIVNFADLSLLRQAYFSTPADPRWNESADFDGNGVVGFADSAIMRSQFFGAPGPSALHNTKQLISN